MMRATVGYRGGDGCYPSEDPDGRGDLSTGPDGRGWQTSDSSHLSQSQTVVLPAQVGPESRAPDSGALLPIWWRKW